MSTKHLLLLHGALYTKEEFAPIIEVLPALSSSHFATTHAIDFSGHGARAGEDVDFGMRRFADDVLAHLDAEGVERTEIFGFSMGGYVGLYLARNHPERIGRVMTLGTKLRWDPATSAREIKMLDADTIEAKVPNFAATLKARHGDAEWRTVLARTATMMTELGDAPALPYDQLADIAAPVRLCLGDRDPMVTIEETVEAYRALPHGQLAILPNTGHPLERVDPRMLIGGLVDFVGE